MQASEDFDYSTPEAQEAMEGLTELILEIRSEAQASTRLYERTLGLAVVPVLLRRLALTIYRRVRAWRQGVR